MFYIPFGMPLGLVFMSIFLIKFSETTIATVNKIVILDDESLVVYYNKIGDLCNKIGDLCL